MKRPTSLCLLVLLAVAACDRSTDPDGPRTGASTEAFHEISRIELDDAPIATIGQLLAWLPLEEEILVTDGMSDRVLAFTLDGTFKKAIGRRGEGPGEFTRPASLLRDRDSTILVTEASQRMTRLSRGLELLEVYRLDVPTIGGQLARVDDRVLLFQWDSRTEGNNFVFWDPTTGTGSGFDPRSELVLTVPYWNATWSTSLAVGLEEMYVGDSMVYPLRRYSLDGTFLGTFGTEPPSWRQASRPEPGQFATIEGQRQAQDWQRSFTVVDAVHVVGREWLVVSHWERSGTYKYADVFRADVYHLDPLRKVWEDIPLPGPVVHGGECAWIVMMYPPDPWTVACWTPKPWAEGS